MRKNKFRSTARKALALLGFITLFVNFSFPQSRNDKAKIMAAIKNFSEASNDSLKRVFLTEISNYYKAANTKYFTAKQLENVLQPEIDQLIGDNIVPIDKISDFDQASKELEYIYFSSRPYSKFIVENDINACADCGAEKGKETYRKELFQKLMESESYYELSTFLLFYFKKQANINSLNQYWNAKELNKIIDKIYESSTYYVAYSELLEKAFHGSISSGMNLNSDKLIVVRDELSDIILTRKECKKCNTEKYPEIFREYEYLKLLNQSEIEKLLTKEIIQKIYKGELTFNQNILTLFQNVLCKSNNSEISELIKRYNFYVLLLQADLNKNYLSDNPVSFPKISEKFLLAQPNSCLLSHALSFEFIKNFISENLSQHIGNSKFANSVTEEIMSNISLLYYALLKNKGTLVYDENTFSTDPYLLVNSLWQGADLKSKIGVQAIITNSNLSDISEIYLNNRIKRIVVTNRTFDFDNYKVVEKCKIKRKWWFTKRFTYTTDIPFQLRNTLRKDTYKALDIMEYSFLERDLEIKYGKNKPFFELIDIVNDDPDLSLPMLANCFKDKNYPVDFCITEIKKKISSGVPYKLFKEIGLKLGRQKDIFNRDIFTDVEAKVMSSLIPDVNKQGFKTQFRDNNSLKLDRNYLNYQIKTQLDNQRASIDVFYGLTMGYNANVRVYSQMNARANSLPIKRDCRWYEALWCNGDRNRKMNATRQFHIDNSSRKINENRNNLNSIQYFNILNLKNPKTIFPFFTTFDSSTNSIFCLVKMEDDNGSHVLSISTDALKTGANLKNADLFWIKYDNHYLQRYNIDLSNLSDHGFEYFAQLSDNFIKENMTENTLVKRLINSGYTKCSDLYPEDQYLPGSSNEFIKNINLGTYLFIKERKLISLIHENNPRANVEAISKINDAVVNTDAELNNKLTGTINQINSSFDEALERWNEWSIFIGFMSSGNTTIPIIQFSGGSLSINIAIPLFGPLPIIPLPRNF